MESEDDDDLSEEEKTPKRACVRQQQANLRITPKEVGFLDDDDDVATII